METFGNSSNEGQVMNTIPLRRELKLTHYYTKRLVKRAVTLAFGRRAWSVDEVKQEVAKICWFHKIDLGHGIVTPGVDNSPEKLPTFGIPDDLHDWTVLDVGAWDGFFSFEAERRGARRVLATDHFCWGGGGWGTGAGFELAREVLHSRVEGKRIDVLDLSPRTVGVFDLVLFLGVLYHMRHPLLALERIASVTKKRLILETHVDMLDCPRPAMAYYPGTELGGDPTNWCGPNPAMVDAMLKTAGFQKVVIHSGPTYHTPHSPRMIFHAWK
jgi:tRNA (mo5U34)-methyltransferase